MFYKQRQGGADGSRDTVGSPDPSTFPHTCVTTSGHKLDRYGPATHVINRSDRRRASEASDEEAFNLIPSKLSLRELESQSWCQIFSSPREELKQKSVDDTHLKSSTSTSRVLVSLGSRGGQKLEHKPGDAEIMLALKTENRHHCAVTSGQTADKSGVEQGQMGESRKGEKSTISMMG
ncbi:hypothetical protein RRG08_042882 [Elysia crispata]|uniref:Uncharacterized protein n=1 Tax=Elysia crispata TaxID=231223 RepID=A0AAE1D5H8_9GAST|nr:hypothetical protein RRG08_042882 [Elysia crispata]